MFYPIGIRRKYGDSLKIGEAEVSLSTETHSVQITAYGDKVLKTLCILCAVVNIRVVMW
jgi:hypothetical protein